MFGKNKTLTPAIEVLFLGCVCLSTCYYSKYNKKTFMNFWFMNYWLSGWHDCEINVPPIRDYLGPTEA